MMKSQVQFRAMTKCLKRKQLIEEYNTKTVTTEELGLPEDASIHQQSGTGKSILPSPMMADNAATLSTNLRELSDSVSAFQCCFTELHQHIDSIRSTIHSVLPGLAINTSTLVPASPPPAAVSPAPALAPEPISKPEPSWESDPSEEEGEEEEEEMQSPHSEEMPSPHREKVQSPRSEEVQSPHHEKVQSPRSEEVPSPRSEEVQSPHSEEVQSPHSEEVQPPHRESSHHSELESPHCSELKNICKSMNGRHLRRHMVTRISDINKLLEEVPKALKLSRNPARLVLECMGKFYFQGGNSYTKGSHMVRGRKAAVLVLECFLLMGIDGVEIEKAVKEEAKKAALAWRQRLIAEGGVGKAYEMDARGLLLLIGCFGIPGGFRNEDIRDLLLVSHITTISRALRRSKVLMAKITEIIEGMVKQNMEVDAVHIAYTFGIDDRFNPQRLLTSFLVDSKESLKKRNEKSQGFLAAVNEVKKKHLFALKSVIKCLKLHDIDPSKLLPGWQINEEIMSLEKEIGEFDKQIGEKMARKRQSDESESSSRSRNREAKRSCIPPWLRQQRVDDHVNFKNTLLEGRTTVCRHGYSVSSSVLRGPAAGSIHENVAVSLAGTVRGVAMGVAGAGISANADGIHAGISAGTDVVQQGGSYAGGHGGTLVDSTPGKIGSHTGQLYGRRGDAIVYDRLAPCSYRLSSYLEGSKGLLNSQLSDAYRPPPYLEGSVGMPNTMHSDAYMPPPYLKGSRGLPNTIPSDASGRSSASDIYQVADTVAASELYMSSGLRAVDTISSAASAYPSSNLYWPR